MKDRIRKLRLPRSDDDLARRILANVAALRGRADSEEDYAGLFERLAAGLRRFPHLRRWADRADQWADSCRHQAKLDRMLADQQEAGVESGIYLHGHRQHLSVEEQCGCDRYCSRPRRPQ